MVKGLDHGGAAGEGLLRSTCRRMTSSLYHKIITSVSAGDCAGTLEPAKLGASGEDLVLYNGKVRTIFVAERKTLRNQL